MSEFELNLFRQRAREAFVQKVRRGVVLWEVPAGFVRTADNRVEKSPDRQVQAAIASVFQKFHELGSARQTLLYVREAQIRLPTVVRGSAGRDVVWQPPTASRIQQILRNPMYAGVFAYGRTELATTLTDGQTRTMRRRKAPEGWSVFLPDHHEGYITWDAYQQTQRMLEANVSRREVAPTGAARHGTALLSGLLRCGRCGRRFFVAYGGANGRVPRYECRGGRATRGTDTCLALGGLRVDRAVVAQVLEAIQPAGIEASLTAMRDALHDDAAQRQAIMLALEKARYEARRAQRQFDAVDPDNRLVAAELEQRWNQALAQTAAIEERLQRLGEQAAPLTDPQRERLLELGTDLRQLWHHPDAPIDLQKRILRIVLEDIVVTPTEEGSQHLLRLHWTGGVHTELRVARNHSGQHRHVADEKAVELIVELSKICDDNTTAVVLNRLGYRTGRGNTWRVHHVRHVRSWRGLPTYRHDGTWVALEGAARALGVSTTVIKRLIADGMLPATQVVPCAPWVIARDDLQRPAVQAHVQAVHDGRKLPRPIPGQHELPLKSNTSER